MEQLTFGDAPAAARPDAAVTGYAIERELAAAGSARVAGVDEVGRGAWAGPVVVCAVIARAGFPAPPDGLTDSKRLTARRRARLAAELPAWVECYAIGEASHEEIDGLGMTAALRRAAVRALDGLAAPPPGAVLLDGSHDYIGRPWPVRCAVKADLRSVSVAAASVLAKVHRDNLMAELGRLHAEFAFEENAGYPSPGPPARPRQPRADPVPPAVLVLPGRPAPVAASEENPARYRGPAFPALTKSQELSTSGSITRTLAFVWRRSSALALSSISADRP